MTQNKYVVEHNVPQINPTTPGKRGRRCIYPWAVLKKGDSFLIPTSITGPVEDVRKEANKILKRVFPAGWSYGQRHNRKFSFRSVVPPLPQFELRPGVRIHRVK